MGPEARGASLSEKSAGLIDYDFVTSRWSAYSDGRVVCALCGAALIIRLYLIVTSYCISADGVAYIAMARDFHAGNNSRALAWVFSPLYPWLISVIFRLTANWELAGELLSLFFGTATVALLYYLMREVFERRAVATCAAALSVIHPLLASLAASVRTEAGYMALLAASTLLFVRAVRLRQIAVIAADGAVCGLAYLYRTEGIGVPVVLISVLLAGGVVWRQWSPRWGLLAAAVLAIAFAAVSSPYLVWMRIHGGHWTVGRELGVVTMEATGAATGRLEQMRELGYRPGSSWLGAVRMDPSAYARKVGRDLIGSVYSLVQAMEPLLFAALVLGLWIRGKAIFARWTEATLALLVATYFIGFVLTDTGPRLMMHLALLTFGWAAIGLEAVAIWLKSSFSASRSVLQRIPWGWTVAGVIAISMLPRTLWPLGYDQRALRYAGAEILRSGTKPAVVAGPDVRAAYYAGAGFIPLPGRPADRGICGWLADHRAANYLMMDDGEERRWDISGATPCLSLVKRYPRTGSTYYDLFALRGTTATALPGTTHDDEGSGRPGTR
jgi:4-amino-4-deoxy-L-arabinose transferase-like glycosyltransferase